MKIPSGVVIVGAALVAFAGVAFAGTQHNVLFASPVASVKSPSPSASPRSPLETPEPAETPEPSDSPDTADTATAGIHPCNHGFYVSQAAHAQKGGKFVSTIAKSDLGKNGNCTAPLPTPAP